MKKFTVVLLMLARVLWVIQLVVGFGIWFGFARSATAAHGGLGMLFVLVVWVLAIFALFALPRRGLALLTLAVGAVVAWFGMAQVALLPGPAHWIVRVVHLLLGIAALGLAEALGKAVKVNEARKAEAA